jgi:hypothetical protein
MKSLFVSRNLRFLVIFCAVVGALSIASLQSRADRLTSSTSVNIVNNSSRQIVHVYFSAVGANDWTADQLSAPIAPGSSFTFTSSYNCGQTQFQGHAEDQDGCFVSMTTTCGGKTKWTITDSTARDCGN